MPMKTTLSGRRPRMRAARAACAAISPAERLRVQPLRPLAQKAHPQPHPTWLETQTVVRPFAAGMRTVSTSSPSARRERILRVPVPSSPATSSVASAPSRSSQRSASAARSARGRFAISSQRAAKRVQSHSASWRARNRSPPASRTASASSSGPRP